MAELDHEDERSTDAAAEAFESLRIEVASLGRAITAIPAALASSGLEPVDYAPSFGAITKALNEVTQRLGMIEAHPALKLTPDLHARAIERAGASVMQDALRALRDETDGIRREREHLAGIVGAATLRTANKRTRRRIFGAGMVAGLVLFPILAIVTPGGSYLAAWSAGTVDRWQAGWNLIAAASPEATQKLRQAYLLQKANAEALQVCAEAARKAGRGQKCTVNVGGE